MDRIQLTARFPHISSRHIPEFKRVAARALAITKDEPGTVQYDWFFNADETVCVVRETYANSDAVLAHIANLGELIGKLIEVGGGCEFEVFGNPSAQLREASAALAPSVFSYFQGK
jgi:hypothetical protein